MYSTSFSPLEGRYKNIPYEERLCPCEAGVVEIVAHVLLYCSFYTGIHDTFIHPILQSIPGRDDEYYTCYLLAYQCPSVAIKVASFCAAALVCRQEMVP